MTGGSDPRPAVLSRLARGRKANVTGTMRAVVSSAELQLSRSLAFKVHHGSEKLPLNRRKQTLQGGSRRLAPWSCELTGQGSGCRSCSRLSSSSDRRHPSASTESPSSSTTTTGGCGSAPHRCSQLPEVHHCPAGNKQSTTSDYAFTKNICGILWILYYVFLDDNINKFTKLNETLRLIDKHPSGLCDNCNTEESVEHVVLHCHKYTQEREALKKGIKEMTLKNIFSIGIQSLFH
ncbi:hypothetical protein F2P81_011062 [Scophthalmus maximus]|uniref:Uncharacterized protein n=1 Tax=Scophthalmus maximus TaxID=52904 RepID=A0A6A4SV35_SCOMX|nr:hypothetical protein F2P81_011062 [Scophthalmus maximus]